MEFEVLALAVDDLVEALAPCGDPARLFGVVTDRNGLVLLPMWSGVARELPGSLVPPPGLRAIALETSGWASPMDEGRPSAHPLRRRVHHTVLISGRGEDMSVLRYEDGAPQVLHGAVGVVFDCLVVCWARRADAIGASQRVVS